MTPFEGTTPPEIPYPPVDIPTPNLPQADFTTIGANLEAGVQAAKAAASAAPAWLDWIADLIAKIMAALLSILLRCVTFVLTLIFQVFNGADSSMNNLAVAAIQGMFGIAPSAGAFTNLLDPTARQQTATNIAQLVTGAFKTGLITNADGTIAPSSAGGDAFMKLTSHMAIEGWLQGWIFEAVSAGQIETFAELKDILERTLGLGRLARRVMAAPVKIFVEDPWTWLLNQTYHPTLLTPADSVREYIRGAIDRGTLQARMDLQGYTSDKVDALVNLNQLHVSPGDLQLAVDTNALTADQAIQRLQNQGYTAADANLLMLAAQQASVRADAKAYGAELDSMFQAQLINAVEFQTRVNELALRDIEKRNLITRGLYKFQNRRKFISLGQAQQLAEAGIYSADDYIGIANLEGYTVQDQQSLEALLTVKELNTAAAQAKKDAAASAAAARQKAAAAKAAAAVAKANAEVEEKGVSISAYRSLVYTGARSYADYLAYLLSKGIAPDNAQSLVDLAQQQDAAKAAAAQAKAAAAANPKVKKLPLAQLESAVENGTLTMSDLALQLSAANYDPKDAGVIMANLQNKIDAAADKAKALAATKAAAAQKHVDLSQEENAVRLGIATPADYDAFLTAHGFQPEDIAVLDGELQAQLTKDKATAAKQAAAAAKLATKGINLSQLVRLVRAGVKTVSDYQAALVSAGYDAADVASMVEFLQLQMTQDQQSLAVSGHAAALVGQMGVSLSDLERAAKLGVVPVATYTDALQRAGVSAADQQTLTNTLATEIRNAAAAKTTEASVSKQVAAAGLSLATLEKDATAGKISTDQLSSLLAGYGVSSTDAADVVSLVTDQIANAKAVAALVAQANARAAAKGLSLAQDTAAYKAGVETEAEWRARVSSLGYDDADVEILFETLAAAQAATAAKAAAKAGTSTTTAAAAAPAGTTTAGS